MTAAVLRSSPNLAVPPTQNTAPVHEFSCLYTHDLRRKQKRWHDGFLRYHTFNKRVMVYDVPRNFLGDLHWNESEHFDEGVEMTLEKGGIIVQVAERLGETQTDLTVLRQRKDQTPAKTPAPSRTHRAGTPLGSVPSPSVHRTPVGASQLPMKHKSLNALLGGPSRRPIGKASLPTESPFEARNRRLDILEKESARPEKRQKLEASHGKKVDSPTVARARRNEITQANKESESPAPRPRLQKDVDVIHISSDTEDSLQAPAIEAELLATSSPARNLQSPAHNASTHFEALRQPHQRASGPDQSAIESPSIRVHNRARAPLPPKAALVPRVKEVTLARTAVSHEGKDAAASKPANGDSRRVTVNENLSKSDLFHGETDTEKRGKSLKLVSGAPRRMLVIQSQKSRPAGLTGNAIRESSHEVQKAIQETGDKTFQQKMQERLARAGQRKRIALHRSSSDVTEQQMSRKKVATGTGLKKTNSVVMPRSGRDAMIEDATVADFPMSDVTLSDSDESALQVDATTRQANGSTSRVSLQKPFKPLAVKPAGSNNKSVQAEVKKKKEDIGPWSKEAFDLMDWRPPTLEARSEEAAKVPS